MMQPNTTRDRDSSASFQEAGSWSHLEGSTDTERRDTEESRTEKESSRGMEGGSGTGHDDQVGRHFHSRPSSGSRSSAENESGRSLGLSGSNQGVFSPSHSQTQPHLYRDPPPEMALTSSRSEMVELPSASQPSFRPARILSLSQNASVPGLISTPSDPEASPSSSNASSYPHPASGVDPSSIISNSENLNTNSETPSPSNTSPPPDITPLSQAQRQITERERREVQWHEERPRTDNEAGPSNSRPSISTTDQRSRAALAAAGELPIRPIPPLGQGSRSTGTSTPQPSSPSPIQSWVDRQLPTAEGGGLSQQRNSSAPTTSSSRPAWATTPSSVAPPLMSSASAMASQTTSTMRERPQSSSVPVPQPPTIGTPPSSSSYSQPPQAIPSSSSTPSMGPGTSTGIGSAFDPHFRARSPPLISPSSVPTSFVRPDFLPSESNLLEVLSTHLRCRRCRKGLTDPITLGCGHSGCYSCVFASSSMSRQSFIGSSTRDLSLDHQDSNTTRQRSGSASSQTQSSFIQNLVARVRGTTPPSNREGELMGLDSSSPASFSTPQGGLFGRTDSGGAIRFDLPGRAVCVVPGCQGRTIGLGSGPNAGGGATGSSGRLRETARIDVVLQKLVAMARKEIGEDDWLTPEMDDEDDDDDDGQKGKKRVRYESPLGSEGSGSSAGGEDKPKGKDLSKRDRKQSNRWRTGKRARVGLPDTVGLEEDLSQQVLDIDRRMSEKTTKSQADSTGDNHTGEKKSSAFVYDIFTELECHVCFMVFLDPVTTPCGHTFCKKCLARSLDHSDKCPLCRAEFPGFGWFQDSPANGAVMKIILRGFSELYLDRKAAVEQEERDRWLDTPIFVCALAFPNMPTFLHVFEPRYRLMIRRCLEGNRRFGMCLPSRQGGGVYEYGCILDIRRSELLPDGRFMLETMGVQRFKVLEKGVLDGYTVGRIEMVNDITTEQERELEAAALARAARTVADSSTEPSSSSQASGAAPPAPAPSGPTTPAPAPSGPTTPTPAPSGPTTPAAGTELTTVQLMGVCREFVQTLRSGSTPWVLQRLNNTVGPEPTNPSDFSYWMAAVMPIDEYEKAKLLQITSPRLRLRLLVHWIQQLRGSWWFVRGCTIM